MSKKDYVAIAEILRETAMESETRAQLVARFVTVLADDNARFSPSRFRDAATPEEDRIEARGRTDGRAAGSWVVDGRTSAETAAAIVRGIDDGDPAILDELPLFPRVGGEWADELTWSDILEQEGCEGSDDDRQDLFDLYCLAYAAGSTDEIVTNARALLA